MEKITLRKPVHHHGLFFMGDILGYKQIVNNKTREELDDLMTHFIALSIAAEEYNFNIPVNDATFYDAIKETWKKDTKLCCYIFSDTIIIYPSVNYQSKSLEYQVSFHMLSSMVITIFTYLLENYNVLLRGAIVDNEFTSIKEPLSVYGKAVVEAHKYEEEQNWGGVLVTKSVIDKLIFDNLEPLKKYRGVPFKDTATRGKFDLEKYVLDWTLSINDNVNWPKIILNASTDDAALKVINTMKFYYANK